MLKSVMLAGILSIISSLTIITLMCISPSISLVSPQSFIIFLCTERVIETFAFKRNWVDESDSLLSGVIWAYTIMVIVSVYENRTSSKTFSTQTIIPFLLYLFSLFIRFLSIYKLKEHWSISSNKLHDGFIRNGIYSLCRHPYYLGVMLEAVTISIILQSVTGFILAVITVIPLEVLRARKEENQLIEINGESYIDYINEKNAFLPLPPWREFFGGRKPITTAQTDHKRRKTNQPIEADQRFVNRPND